MAANPPISGLGPAVWRVLFIEEVCMFRVQAPVVVVPTAEAKQAVGVHLCPAGQAAYREVAMAAKGLEIAHLQFGLVVTSVPKVPI